MKRSAFPFVLGVYGRVRRCLAPSFSPEILAEVLSELRAATPSELSELAMIGAEGDAVLLRWRRAARGRGYEQNTDREIRSHTTARGVTLKLLGTAGRSIAGDRPRVGHAHFCSLSDLSAFLPGHAFEELDSHRATCPLALVLYRPGRRGYGCFGPRLLMG
jgi:hypothetical protein